MNGSISISSSNNNLIQGDALTELSKLEPETVDCCITSPPYWALRDYKVDGQLGLEPTIDEYVNKLTAIFDQVKRVLKKTGTCWVVIGDTYNGNKNGNTLGTGKGSLIRPKTTNQNRYLQEMVKKRIDMIPDKSLCMIPERFAIAMVDKGWILRNKIIWHKPNCMPSSAKDRFTVDWEYVFFFVKNQKYFFETQYEPLTEPDRIRNPMVDIVGGNKYANIQSHNPFKQPSAALGRIKRAVWRISTSAFSGTHFAVFPPKLIEPMIKAGCPTDGTVLDPFMGAGTTGMVALQNARDFIGIELNPSYIEMARKRLNPWLKQERLITTQCHACGNI